METRIPFLLGVDAVAPVLAARVGDGWSDAAAGPGACGDRPSGTALTMEDLWADQDCGCTFCPGSWGGTSPSVEPSAVRRHRG